VILLPCWPAINPRIEKMANPANMLVAQLVIDMIKESLKEVIAEGIK